MSDSMSFSARLGLVALATALVAGTAPRAGAQSPAPIQGWQALIGCWEPAATARAAAPDSTRGHLVCILPVEGSSAVDFVTIIDGKAGERERVDATGARQSLTRDDCSGWQSAEWSATGYRLYLRSELTCAGGLKRASTGIISMPTTSEWVDVQSVAVGERRAARTLRYRAADSYAAVPAAEVAELGTRPSSIGVSTARIAAATPVSPADIVEVTRRLDVAAVEMWLAEQQLAFKADASRLVQLADAGVPASVIDMVVALSYPERFTVATADQAAGRAQGDAQRLGDRPYGGGGRYYDPFWDPYYGSRYDRGYYSPYGYSRYGSGGYYYDDYRYYSGRRPVVIVVTQPTSPDTVSRGGGRVVNGRGYTRRPASTPETDRTRDSGSRGEPSSSTGSSTGSSSSGSGSSSTGSSGSSGSSGERTARRRPPPGTN